MIIDKNLEALENRKFVFLQKLRDIIDFFFIQNDYKIIC
jgi:hypothetical protein